MSALSRLHLPNIRLRITQGVIGVVFVLSVGLTLAGLPARNRELVANQDNFSPLVSGEFVVGYNLFLEILLAGVFFSSAAVIAAYRVQEPLALFLAASLAALGATETGMSDALINPLHNPGGVTWHTPVFALRSFAMGAGLILLYSFPDGRWTPRWTRPLAYIWGALNILWFLFPTIPFNPNDGPTWRATPVASLIFGISWFGSGVVAQALRGRRVTDPIQQQQTKWSAYGLSAAVLGGALFYGYSALKEPFSFLVEGSMMGTVYVIVRPTLKVIGMSLLPICLGIAILRYRLFDIDLIINRTLVYALLTGLSISVYLIVAGGVSTLLQSEGNLFAALLAAGVVAVLFQPLREYIQRGINRLVYGERDDPYRLLSSLGQKLENTFAPQATLAAIVETIGRGLKLPYAAITVRHDADWSLEAEYHPDSQSVLHSTGQSIPENWPGTRLPIIHQSRQVGQLLLSPRAPGETFSRSDLRILEDLARQAGIAVHAIQLQNNLQLARQRLINTREEERRRLRRDLHDSLGPTLASLTLQVDAARNLVRRDPEQAEALLEAIACQTHDLVGDIRQLVYGLRPPALDELGLIPALREKIFQHGQSGLQIHLDAPDQLSPLPAAVEVAAYRIVLEALTNVTRHAGARRCQISLELQDETLYIHIQDDGRGMPEGQRSGAGLHTMRERAIELGGSFEIHSQPGLGVSIQARLPAYTPQAAPDETMIGI